MNKGADILLLIYNMSALLRPFQVLCKLKKLT